MDVFYGIDPEELAKQANMIALKKIFDSVLPKDTSSAFVLEILSIFLTHGVELKTALDILMDICQIQKGDDES